MVEVIAIKFIRQSCILFFCVFLCVILSDFIENRLTQHRMKELSITDETFREMDLSDIDVDWALTDAGEMYEMEPYELILTAIYYDLDLREGITWDKSYIWKQRNRLIQKYDDFADLTGIVKNLLTEMEYFPVPQSTGNMPYVEFENSWKYERTYGGKRFHEGCDIMALKNVRGVYPVVSVCDGTVEKMGWLEKGGYRVGIRSDSGIYYYYAHLSEYSGIQEGDRVSAGELLGFMGDTGYSTVEGTTGMFDVHLHFGIYVNDRYGNEISLNPYYFLRRIDKNVLYFEYGM